MSHSCTLYRRQIIAPIIRINCACINSIKAFGSMFWMGQLQVRQRQGQVAVHLMSIRMPLLLSPLHRPPCPKRKKLFMS